MTEAERDTRDRVIRMEGKVEAIEKRLEEMEEKIDKIEASQAQILNILTQGKGIVWFLQKMWPAVVWGGALVITYWASIRSFLAKIGG